LLPTGISFSYTRSPMSATKPKGNSMSCLRVLLCIIFPPLAVIDKGCGSILIVTILTLLGWIPGVIGALIICNRDT
jgi:uncharacterized membrane protein YqaE (UPF0057 family)